MTFSTCVSVYTYSMHMTSPQFMQSSHTSAQHCIKCSTCQALHLLPDPDQQMHMVAIAMTSLHRMQQACLQAFIMLLRNDYLRTLLRALHSALHTQQG